ncbi:hypothetical protein EJB05_37030, partial [Eragrostis curvula]
MAGFGIMGSRCKFSRHGNRVAVFDVLTIHGKVVHLNWGYRGSGISHDTMFFFGNSGMRSRILERSKHEAGIY